MTIHSLITTLRKQSAPKHHFSQPEQFLNKLTQLLSAANIKAQAVFGGSYAKGTYLENDHDIDIFVRFNKKYSDTEMTEALAPLLSKIGTVQRIHGSRDYFQITQDGFHYEIVPVLAITTPEEAQNTTDMSPMHVAFVLKHAKKNPYLTSDIRLAKLFCKSAQAYGAESYINGFSGHVIDLLIINYGSFLAFVQAAAQWEDKVFIDIHKKHESATFLNAAKRTGPLVVLDPVQPERNAAAAVSVEKFTILKEHAQAFLAAPSKQFFIRTPITKKTIMKDYPHHTLCYTLKPLSGSKDVAGTKLLKIHEFFLKQAKKAGFSLLHEGFAFQEKEAFCFLVVKEEPLSEIFEIKGPPVSVVTDVKRFKAAHKEVFTRDKQLFAKEKRTCRTLEELFSLVMQDPYALSRSLGAKII